MLRRYTRRAALLAAAALLTPALPIAPAAAGCNSGPLFFTDPLTSINCQAVANGDESLAVGNLAHAGGDDTDVGDTALGEQATAGLTGGSFNTAIGRGAVAGLTDDSNTANRR